MLETREPTAGPIGQRIRALIAERGEGGDPRVIALLFAADRLEHLRTEVEPALERGDVVVCDRYVISSWVYQSLECDPDWVRSINTHARWPDYTAILEVDPTEALNRVHARTPEDQREIYEKAEVQERVARGYTAVAAEGLPNVHRIDGAQSLDAVTQSLLDSLITAGF